MIIAWERRDGGSAGHAGLDDVLRACESFCSLIDWVSMQSRFRFDICLICAISHENMAALAACKQYEQGWKLGKRHPHAGTPARCSPQDSTLELNPVAPPTQQH